MDGVYNIHLFQINFSEEMLYAVLPAYVWYSSQQEFVPC